MKRYRAARLPVHTGPAAWSAILGPAPLRPRLESATTADAVIVGAGFAGLAAARRLKQIEPDAEIVVLEAGRIAEGAAGRNSGFMIDLPHELTSDDYAGAGDQRSMIELNRFAIDFAGRAVDDYGIAPGFYDPVGKINGAASAQAEEQAKAYAEHLTDLEEPFELLDAQTMHEITGSRHYRSGLFTPGTVQLQPAGYVRGMATGLAASGVRIFEGSAAKTLKRDGTGWQVGTAKGQVSTPRVLLTVNGHLESFGIERGRLMQIFLFAVMTPELSPDALAELGGQSRWGITPSDPMGTTVRRIDWGQGGNRIVTRTCAVLRPGMETSEADLSRAAGVMQKKFAARFPKLANIKMEYSWAGHLCLTTNGVAVMREIEDGLWSGCVQNGLGTARGTLTGIGAAELAAGVESPITQHFTKEPRPSRLPPRPFRDIGANAVLRWREWRARND